MATIQLPTHFDALEQYINQVGEIVDCHMPDVYPAVVELHLRVRQFEFYNFNAYLPMGWRVRYDTIEIKPTTGTVETDMYLEIMDTSFGIFDSGRNSIPQQNDVASIGA